MRRPDGCSGAQIAVSLIVLPRSPADRLPGRRIARCGARISEPAPADPQRARKAGRGACFACASVSFGDHPPRIRTGQLLLPASPSGSCSAIGRAAACRPQAVASARDEDRQSGVTAAFFVRSSAAAPEALLISSSLVPAS